MVKGAWAYPYSNDFKTVNSKALVAIRVRAAQQGERDVFEAAGKLLEAIKKRDEGKDVDDLLDVKVGRVLNRQNESRLRDAISNIDEASKIEGLSRRDRALLRETMRLLQDVLSELDSDGKQVDDEEVSVEEAIAVVLNKTTPIQRERLMKALEVLAKTRK